MVPGTVRAQRDRPDVIDELNLDPVRSGLEATGREKPGGWEIQEVKMEKAKKLKARDLGPEKSTDLAFILASIIAKAQAVELALEEEESAWSGPELIELLRIFQSDATEALAVLGITQDEYTAISGEIVAEMMSDDDE